MYLDANSCTPKCHESPLKRVRKNHKHAGKRGPLTKPESSARRKPRPSGADFRVLLKPLFLTVATFRLRGPDPTACATEMVEGPLTIRPPPPQGALRDTAQL